MSSGPELSSFGLGTSKPKSLDERRRLMYERLNARHTSRTINASTVMDSASNLSSFDELQSRVRQLLDDSNAPVELSVMKELEDALSVLPAGLQSRRLKDAYNELKIRLQRQMTGTHCKSAFAFSSKPSGSSSKQSTPEVTPASRRMDDAGDTGASGGLKTTSITTKTVPADNTITLTDKEGEFIKLAGSGGEDVSLNTIRNCRIAIPFNASAVHLKDVHDSLVVLAPVSSSILIRNCANLSVIAAAQQIRVHSSHHLKMHIAVRGAIIIENCNDLSIAPYSVKNITLNWQNDSWRKVQDFNWLSDKTNPHYSIADESLWYTYDIDTCEPYIV